MMASAASVCAVPMDQFDAQLVRKLGKSGPRYTSSPTADRFSAAFDYRE